MAKDLLLAIDQGTTSSRAIVFSMTGEVKALVQEPFSQIFPHDGWVEHDADCIWNTQLDVLKRVLAAEGVKPDNLAGIGITNQRETTVLWDRGTGKPLANAIVWQDRRTAAFCEALVAQGLESVFSSKTGLVLDPYFSGTKLHWLLQNIPGARQRAARGELAFGTIDTWLLWKLTNGRIHATDVTNASRTLLFNIDTLDWDDELLSLLDIPRQILPDVVSSSSVVGTMDAELCGLPLPLAGIAGDQQAALFGHDCLQPGAAKNTYGTGCFTLLNTGSNRVHSKHRLLTTLAWRCGDDAPCYALEGSIFVGGAAVQWLRDGLGLIDSAADIQALARTVPDSGGVVFVPALTGLGAPHWDPYARGTILGINRATTSAHLAHATLEAVAHQVTDVIAAMTKDSGLPLRVLQVDGGASGNDLLLQIQADLLQIPVVRSPIREATAFGAARLAGLALGLDVTLPAHTRADVFRPLATASDVAVRRALWQEACSRARGWARS